MIKIRENLFLMPSHLVLLEGKDIPNKVIDDISNMKLSDFNNAETPKTAMKKIQDTENVDYSYCFPITGGICVSEKCQLRCNYCAFDSKESGTSIISMEQAKPFINFLISNLIMRRFVEPLDDEVLDLYFAGGGEPTYEWNVLVEIVEYVKKMCIKHNINFTFGITTNAILNPKQLKYISDNFNLITISFDGLPKLQDKNRVFSTGRGTYETVDKSLKYFAEAGKSVVMRSTIWPEDYHELNNIVKYVFENYPNVSVLDVEPINNRGRAARSEARTLNNDFVEYYIEAKKYLSKKGLEDKLVCGKFKDNIVNFICGTSYGKNPWLLPNGNVVTCIDAKENSAVVAKVVNGTLVKNVFTDNILNIYIEKRQSCLDCYAYKFCGGGCPLRYINYDEEKNNELECAMIRKYWTFIFHNLINDIPIFGWECREIVLEDSNIKARQIWRKTWKSE